MSINYPDDLAFTNESPEAALRRRVRMHEFLATGGIQVGIDKKSGRTMWSRPIDPMVVKLCPWHPAPCSAWEEIRAGRGSGEVPSPTLPELREQSRAELRDKRERLRVAREQADGVFDPRFGVPGGDERVYASAANQDSMAWFDDPDFDERLNKAERDKHQRPVYGSATQTGYRAGNPSSQPRPSWAEQQRARRIAAEEQQRAEHEENINALVGAIPDEIVFDDDEHDDEEEE